MQGDSGSRSSSPRTSWQLQQIPPRRRGHAPIPRACLAHQGRWLLVRNGLALRNRRNQRPHLHPAHTVREHHSGWSCALTGTARRWRDWRNASKAES